jgi:CMP-N-acetylneuraminic acid synthetase|tara:strand:- start:537 stop:1271 length:735 start_codon:yes stop_codon:yes gene_type:complete
MICALMIGRANSVTLPGKNIFPILGRKLCEYPLLAASKSKYIDRIFVSTDCPVISKTSKDYKADVIKRPSELATNKALGEDAFRHGYFEIKKIIESENKKIELVVLLFANAPTITAKLIDEGIEILQKNKNLDSAVTTSIYNMWSPLRARKVDSQGTLQPFVPFETFGDPKELNCDRDSQGNVYYADMSASVVRPYCLEKLEDGLLPQKWMGKKIAPIHSWGGCDVDYEWQIPMVEFWLKKNGY